MNIWRQWPSGIFSPKYFDRVSNFEKNSLLKKEIEDFFTERFGYQSVLFPSARNAIYSLMLAKGITRLDRVYIPNFSSNCLYSIFGRCSSVSTDYNNQKIVLVNHKWGIINHTHANPNTAVIIEDSCDSIITNESLVFPNGGDYQILSLPKIIGSISGGLILFRNRQDAIIAKLIQNQSISDNRNTQFKLKSKYYKNNMLSSSEWEHFEYSSQGLIRTELIHIIRNLEKLDQNFEIIQKRRAVIRNNFANYSIGTSYAGPVAIFRVSTGNDYQDFLGGGLIREYFFDLSLINGENTDFSPVYIFPIHMGISDEEFALGLESIMDENSRLDGAISFID